MVLGHGGADAPGDLHGLGLGRPGQHDDELLAAVARDQIGAARAPLDDARRGPQRDVAGGVSQTVVVLLEEVEIAEEQRHATTLVTRPVQLLGQTFVQIAMVVETRSDRR